MANARLLSDLLSEIRASADIEGLTDRHPDATLIVWLNQEWRRFRAKAAHAGMDGLTVPSAIAALPTSPPVSTEQYLQVDWPDGAVGVYGVDVLTGSKWVPLKPMSFAMRRDFQDRGATESFPAYWHPLTLPTENGTSVDAGKIGLFPLATGGNNYRIWYLPLWVDITDPTHAFYGHDIWFSWLVQAMVRRIAQKDDDAANTLAEAVRQQAEIWEDIKRSITMMNAAENVPRVRRNRRTRGRWGS